MYGFFKQVAKISSLTCASLTVGGAIHSVMISSALAKLVDYRSASPVKQENPEPTKPDSTPGPC